MTLIHFLYLIYIFYLPDVGDVQSRLFDHRPFIQGETKFMLKEFEARYNFFFLRYYFLIIY